MGASERGSVCVCVFMHSFTHCVFTLLHMHTVDSLKQSDQPRRPCTHTHTHILKAGGSVAMATGRTAASAAAAIEPDET